MASEIEYDAMRRALSLAAQGPRGVNPQVGCVLIDPAGQIVGDGFHHGAGTPHAEVEALRAAGDLARDATAVVTLEPCDHTGRTGPCSQELIAAGVRRVVFAQTDPNPQAAGGAQTLRAAGIDVESGVLAANAEAINRVWTRTVHTQRPFVTWKFATSLDGRSAAADGTSRWVSSTAARRDTHRLRADCDVMLIGTNTVEVDDPELTVRDEHDQPIGTQPLRVVMGERDLDPGRRIFNDRAQTLQLRSRDPHAVLAQLWSLDKRHVFLEGGPRLAAAFLGAGCVDEIVSYVAPMLLGAGPSAVADLGIDTIAEAMRPHVVDITVLDPVADTADEPNIRITMEV